MADSNTEAARKQLIKETYDYYQFNKNDEVLEIIHDVKNPQVFGDEIALESGCERLTVILDRLQEQPHLLDPFLEPMITNLLETVRDPDIHPSAFHQAFKYLYLITKTRGADVVIRLFTHEVADLEPVLSLLKQQSLSDFKTWETRYMLLLWLSIICIIPFDLSRLDGTSKVDGQGIIDRIFNTAKEYLSVFDKARDAAALLLSKFVTRPDVKKLKLAEFLDWSLITLVKTDTTTMVGVNTLCGVMSTLAQIFKYGNRDDLLKHALVVLQKVEEQDFLSGSNMLLKKLAMKVVQRVGLTLLKPCVAAWRYSRGSRSLVQNLENPSFVEQNVKQDNFIEEKQEKSYDVPEQIESVLEQLLMGLNGRDTVVRWSAAKGIGRITNRLPKDLADDVIASLLDFIRSQETDTGWHGGCLALAELGRRGLLLPERLPDVVPVVLKGLLFDEKRGSFSIGAHVRDAACYVCWSFARAYDPIELKEYVSQIASALLIVSIFDREVNCRRAASAAFQENVGRQGTFPHGIDIVTTADYFAVGNRGNCFLNICIDIARYPEYTQPLIDHLADNKIYHWDWNIRDLSANSLHRLTALSPEYINEKVLPTVLDYTTSIDLNTRHGGIIASAEIAHALCKYYANRDPKSVLGETKIQKLKDMVPNLRKRKHFRSTGGDYMRTAVCRLIEKLSTSKLPFHDDPILDDWLDVIDECLPHTNPTIQEDAAKTLTFLCQEYSRKSDGTANHSLQSSLIDRYIEKLKSSLDFDRMGFALGLGALPKICLKGKLNEVVNALLAASVVDEDNSGTYAAARRDAVKALTSLCVTLGVEVDGDRINAICRENISCIFEGFLQCMNDYAVDNNGDVGAWVREAAMTGIEKLTILVLEADPSLITASLSKRIMGNLAQQTAEKIDRTRAHAGEVLSRLIHHEPKIPHFPEHQQLIKTLPKSEIEDLNWAAPAAAFPQITKLLCLPSYRYSVILGLTVSVGGLTESLVRHSSDSLLSYLRSIQNDDNKIDVFAEEIINVFKNNKKNERVIIPMFKMLDLLFSNGCFDSYVERDKHPFPFNLFKAVKEEITRCGDVKKLVGSINVFCALAQFPGEARKTSMAQLMIFLCHKYPRVRKGTAESLYTVLLVFEDMTSDDNLEQALSVLSETDWDGNLQNLRTVRNGLCDLLDVAKPKLKNVSQAKVSTEAVDELESYRDLVSRDGL